MAHILQDARPYQKLRQQMDHAPTGVPDSPAIIQVLQMLFSPQEADFARRIPTQPVSLAALSKMLGQDRDTLEARLSELALRGLVLDVERDGERYFALAPVLGGVFEFIMMRVRGELPLEKLARLFDQYLYQDEGFVRQSFKGPTQFGRSFPREEALPDAAQTEVLDWERVARVIETASDITVGLCACRHNRSHINKACDRPQRTCLSLNGGAQAMRNMQIADPVSAKEALEIVSECKQLGLAQTGDNVRQSVTYICNCCGCCCVLVNAIRTYNIRSAIVPSNWAMEVNAAKCKGCGRCAEACYTGAIRLVEQGDNQKLAAPDLDLCLGCGVCYGACKNGAVRMKRRDRRPLVPETAFDKTVMMAVERGKLAAVVFENPQTLSQKALGRLLNVLEKSPPAQAALAVEPLRSLYLNALIKRTGKKKNPGTQQHSSTERTSGHEPKAGD